MSKSDIPLNDAEVQNIKKIISTFNDSSLNYLDLELGDLKIKIGKGNLPTQPTVALIEAMKMFNAVPSGVQGHVSKICVTDGELVEYGQILFHVKVK